MSELFNVLLVGGGEIQFGSSEGNWNHSLRLERLLGKRLNVVGVIDPDVGRVKMQLESKRSQKFIGYDSTRTFASIDAAKEVLDSITFDLVIVGTPPHFRGCMEAPANLDLQLLKTVKSKRFLVEKPICAMQPTPSAGLDKVAAAYKSSGAYVAVGYMFKALQAVQKVQKIIAENKLRVMTTQARYYMAYPDARKPAWWNKRISCGPVVEQATHLLQLSLAFGGPVRFSTIRALTVDYDEPAGQLSKLGLDENQVPEDCRIPRCTNAIWKYENGATGSLTHAVALHGNEYSVEFEVICDGYLFKVSGFYDGKPTLHMRRAGGPLETIAFENDDPYQTQLDSLINNEPICSYSEALETYKLSWGIRLAGESAA